MLEFSQFALNVPDIHRFPTVHVIKTHFQLKNIFSETYCKTPIRKL